MYSMSKDTSTGSPLHNFAIYLQKILQTSFPAPCSSYKNSFEIVKKLSNVHISKN